MRLAWVAAIGVACAARADPVSLSVASGTRCVTEASLRAQLTLAGLQVAASGALDVDVSSSPDGTVRLRARRERDARLLVRTLPVRGTCDGLELALVTLIREWATPPPLGTLAVETRTREPPRPVARVPEVAADAGTPGVAAAPRDAEARGAQESATALTEARRDGGTRGAQGTASGLTEALRDGGTRGEQPSPGAPVAALRGAGTGEAERTAAIAMTRPAGDARTRDALTSGRGEARTRDAQGAGAGVTEENRDALPTVGGVTGGPREGTPDSRDAGGLDVAPEVGAPGTGEGDGGAALAVATPAHDGSPLEVRFAFAGGVRALIDAPVSPSGSALLDVGRSSLGASLEGAFDADVTLAAEGGTLTFNSQSVTLNARWRFAWERLSLDLGVGVRGSRIGATPAGFTRNAPATLFSLGPAVSATVWVRVAGPLQLVLRAATALRFPADQLNILNGPAFRLGPWQVGAVAGLALAWP